MRAVWVLLLFVACAGCQAGDPSNRDNKAAAAALAAQVGGGNGVMVRDTLLGLSEDNITAVCGTVVGGSADERKFIVVLTEKPVVLLEDPGDPQGFANETSLYCLEGAGSRYVAKMY